MGWTEQWLSLTASLLEQGGVIGIASSGSTIIVLTPELWLTSMIVLLSGCGE
jgi:hypothetical protein